MDMKLPPESQQLPLDGATGVYYSLLYGIVSFFLVLVALLLLYVACSKKYRLNWFERNLLETAENRELSGSGHETLLRETERRASRSSSRRSWVPAGKGFAGMETLESSDEETDSEVSGASPSGSKNSLTMDAGSQQSGDENSAVVPIAGNSKHVVLAQGMPGKSLVSMNTRLDLSKIDTTLYEQETSDTIVEIDSSRGKLHISLTYDLAAGMLSVRLIEASDLLPKDYTGTADPYAKIRLLPDTSNTWQTRIHKKTLNPVFDEDFVFEVRAMALSRRTLEIVLYDFDANSRHCNMGGLKLPLHDLDLTEKVTLCKPLTILSDTDDKAALGDLMVSLSFLPSAERLTAVIIRARNLRVVDDTKASSDPYVKVTLLQGGKRLKKKKTSIHRNTVNPTFNERLTFDVSKDLLPKCTLEFCVYHDAKLGPSELLGRCLVGGTSSSRPEDRDFFQELMANRSANAKWLVLTDPR